MKIVSNKVPDKHKLETQLLSGSITSCSKAMGMCVLLLHFVQSAHKRTCKDVGAVIRSSSPPQQSVAMALPLTAFRHLNFNPLIPAGGIS